MKKEENSGNAILYVIYLREMVIALLVQVVLGTRSMMQFHWPANQRLTFFRPRRRRSDCFEKYAKETTVFLI